MCPFLSLAVYIFCHGFRDEEGGFVCLFTGDSQEDRYSKTLSNVVENLPVEDLVEIGGNAADIGTHSTRKGAASYVLSHLVAQTLSLFFFCAAVGALGMFRIATYF